jgi:2-dehydropantoate 2-reductase
MPDVAILGSGAVGALVGAELTRSGTTTALITREATAQTLRREGVTVESPRFGDHVVSVDARPRLDAGDGPVDALLVAVKAPHLADALQRIAVEPGIVVPLLNGVEHLAVLQDRFGAERVMAGVVRVQAHRAGPAHVVHRAPFLTISLAAPGAPALEAALRQAGIDVAHGASDAAVLWSKLARLAGLALATAAADAPLGDVRGDAEAVAREVVVVANAEGAELDEAALLAELRGLPDAASSSLRADIVAGAGDNELDAIGAAVLRAAARHDLPTPHTQDLVARVATRAAGG